MRQLFAKKKKRKGKEREEDELNQMEKNLKNIPCLAKLARDREKIVTTDARRNRLRKFSQQKPHYNTSRSKKIANRYLTDFDKEVTERDAILALLLNRLEKEEIMFNGETWGRNSNVSVRKSNQIFKAPER